MNNEDEKLVHVLKSAIINCPKIGEVNTQLALNVIGTFIDKPHTLRDVRFDGSINSDWPPSKILLELFDWSRVEPVFGLDGFWFWDSIHEHLEEVEGEISD